MKTPGSVAFAFAMLLMIGLTGCGGNQDVSAGGQQSNATSKLLADTYIETWTKCADENGTCVFSGTTQVRYGANGTYATLTASSAIACNNDVFGDPVPGADKTCEYRTITVVPDPTPDPTTWTKCADENGTCSFSGTAQVRYGLNGTYATLTATNVIGCNNEVFGDPLPGANKICEYTLSGSTPPPDPDPTPGWTKCADENGICSFSGTTQVRYGLNGTYATLTATNTIGCNNEVFGDPLPGANKICEYATTSTDPNPPPPPGLPSPVPDGVQMTMSCVEGANTQCSGRSIIRTENGVTLTSSGVQAYGKSTNDLATPIVDATAAWGLAPASGGLAEVRVFKASDGLVSNPVLLLSNLGISWDGKVERPIIVETFRTTQGRVQIDSSGMISSGALPPSSNLAFYDVASKGTAATQLNYANNSYFPRSDPSRCPPEMVPCPTIETSGIQHHTGDWQTGGIMPDTTSASRLHGDGDVHAGNGLPDANGNPTILPGGNGFGVPFPGSKGYRQLSNWSYQYANLGAWLTQDTVRIVEWTAGAGSDEHNQARTGMVAFGQVSDPASVPASGKATYSGIVFGWYAASATKDAAFFRGSALITVDFATRSVSVAIQNTHTDDDAALAVPVTMSASTAMGAAGSNVANYLTGAVNNGTLNGGLSGRFFGPVLAGGSGAGPAEIGGSFSLSNATTGAASVGGFIARKQ
ncbi:transferrin-binding protein-like solute binding protein [Herbaspirillum sp. ST 5-3]|uniref:transferrin-binding protein-like solute binding protein n=1 Tax=Oxalobacteraceae TaxID=75682 RepID=UPI0010A31B84|nr:transferrin-binding protein-like solute binding protein [Herbaspirillum sp. ST 5-3]